MKFDFSKAARSLAELNLFQSAKTRSDPNIEQTEKITTRIFIVTFLTSCITLLTYTSTTTSSKTYIISTPSLDQYNSLYQEYSRILSCPCTQISTENREFIQVNYTLHQVCSSFLISDEWIVFLRPRGSTVSASDFRANGAHMFQSLRSLCFLAEESIRISLKHFYDDHHIAAYVTPKELLQSQSEARIQNFITSTVNSFLLSFRLIGNMTQANALFSALFTNYFLNVPLGQTAVGSSSLDYDDGCNCAHHSQCTTQSVILVDNSYIPSWFVPGWYRGCYILEGLRRSRLECFYNQSCLDEFMSHIGGDREPLTVKSIDPSLSPRFDTMTPLGVIIDSMMVEDWKWTINYSKHYEICKPKECSYTITNRNDFINIVTTLIGLVGGLLTALRLIIPALISIIYLVFQQRMTVNIVATVQSSAPKGQTIPDEIRA